MPRVWWMPWAVARSSHSQGHPLQRTRVSKAMDGTLVASSSSSSTSKHIGGWTYDVFLSFRGEDTRKNFVDHLYAALDHAGIYTFKDDQKLQRGKSISPELLKAIEESMVAVVVFSKNYANSSWCLDELVKIVESQRLGQRVLPVFYDVDPSDVRGQKGSYHAAFEQHEVKFKDNAGKVKRWREALVNTANLSGWDVPQIANGHEAECIKQIVRRILSYNEFLPAENLIGMESRVRDVKSLLRKGDNDVLMIGIWGMGGIGKTTIARAVYYQISYEFKGSSFLEAVRENGFDNKGLKSLQEKLLSEILMQENFQVKDCHDGICHIRRRLSRNKVLVVLDDVDDFKQLEFLAGAREWFGPGSRIIVTTRDEHLLCYVQEKYAPEPLQRTRVSKAMDGTLVASSSSSSSSTSRHIGGWTYDVFLSFRGEDTRKNFVDHLYAALDHAGIYTFKDDQKLQRGKSISPELLKAIEESMVAVVVFSKNYANSSWCLDELVKIVECQHLGQRVLPVFYDVDPSDVRGQKGSYHEAFEQHEVKFKGNKGKVKRWREALVNTANLSGWDVPQIANGHEAECIKQIVRRILSYNEFLPAENLIGMESRVRDVKSLLRKGDNDVLMIGIWGMGGIGKTTIARAVYHQISYEFKGSSFLEAVRENGSDNKGLKSLQEKLLSEILMQENFQVKDCHDGICHIRRRLGRNKVLLVLDDVDDFKQLEFLAGAREWFGPGSRIIVTTRDEHLLCYVQEKYAPELLRRQEAMTLFSRYAFKANFPPKTYEQLSDVVVSHSGHLPLALKALGSHFCGRDVDFWQSGMKVLAKIPHKEINGILKLSYDGLNSLEKKLFLHIACFFKGKERAIVTRILDSFGFEPKSGITVLIEKSLLTISNGCLQMHDLIQEMGWCVVRESFPGTMVWVLEEIKEVMTEITRSEKVEAIVDTTPYHFSDTPMPCCSAEVFKTMKKLRLLDVKGKFTASEPKYVPEDLIWLCWYMYPFQSLRIKRGMTKLVGLEMQSGHMKQLQIQKKVILPNLKFMDLSFSCSIASFPDISGVPNLERLNLSFCSDLVDVHQSVLLHERITHLYLSYCDSLRILPSSIYMKSLQTLHLNGCMNLDRFPEVSREMGSLLVLNIDGCERIRELPSSIQLFTGLIILTMGKYIDMKGKTHRQPKDYGSVSSLKVVDLKRSISKNHFPSFLYNARSSLEKLDLSCNNFEKLYLEIDHFSHLKYLNLSHCIKLTSINVLPPLIQVFKADYCPNVYMTEDLHRKYKWLFKISLVYSGRSDLYDLKPFVLDCAIANHQFSLTVRGRNIPKWFNNRREGDKIPLNLPQTRFTEMIGLAMCCRLEPPNKDDDIGGTYLRVIFESTVEKRNIFVKPSSGARGNHLWIGYIPLDFLQKLCGGFNSEDFAITFSSWQDIPECGVRVVYKDDIKLMTRTEPWIPDHMEYGWTDHDGICREDLQHGKWSKQSFLRDTEDGSIKYVRL